LCIPGIHVKDEERESRFDVKDRGIAPSTPNLGKEKKIESPAVRVISAMKTIVMSLVCPDIGGTCECSKDMLKYDIIPFG